MAFTERRPTLSELFRDFRYPLREGFRPDVDVITVRVRLMSCALAVVESSDRICVEGKKRRIRNPLLYPAELRAQIFSRRMCC